MSGVRRALFVLALIGGCKSAVDVTQGHPYACDGDDTECGTGWRCGQNMLCHEIGQPGTYDCRRDAGDCEASWVCGVDNHCIDPTDAGLNACFSDSDCFNGFRCDTTGHCIDPSADLLGPRDSPPGPFNVLGPKLAPQGVTGSAIAYAIEPLIGNPMADAQRHARTVLSSGGQVTVLVANGSNPLFTLDAGSYANVSQLAANDTYAWVRTDTDLLAMGTTLVTPVPVPTQVHDNLGAPLGPQWDLRTTFLDNFGAVALAQDGGSDFHLISGGIGGGVLRHGPGTERSDMLGYGACLFATNQGTLTALAVGSGAWNSVALPELTKDTFTDGGFKALRLRGVTPGLIAVALDVRPVSLDMTDASYPITASTESDVALYDLSALLQPGTGPDAGPPTCVPSLDPTGREARVKLLLGTCNACDFNSESLLDFYPLVLDQRYGVQTDCIENGFLHTYILTETLDGQCQRMRVTSSEPQFKSLLDPPFGGTNPFGLGKAGKNGELWVGDNLINAHPIFLDRAPGGIYQPDSHDGGTTAVRVFADEWVAEQTSLGFEVQDNTGQQPTIVSTIGDPSSNAEVVYSDRRLSQLFDTGQNIFATVGATDDTFLPPYGARTATRSDGFPEYIVRSFDSLYAGPRLDRKTNFTLRLQLVPAAGSPILAGVFQTPRDLDAGQLEGYVLTAAGVQAVSEDNMNSWSATPVVMPPGVRIAVFSEGEDGPVRVAYEDGRVYSLPSRVLLAPKVPVARFASFIHACSETWGMSDQGLYRLHPLDGGTGVWLNEPLDAADPYNNFSPQSLSGGKMVTMNNQFIVFNAFGGAVSFVPQAGCGHGSDAGM